MRKEEESGEVAKEALIVTKSGGEVGLSKCCILMRPGSGWKETYMHSIR